MFNSFSWYFLGRITVAKYTNIVGSDSVANLCLEAAFPLSIIISALIGAAFLSKAQKTRFLRNWFLIGTMASLFPAIPVGNSFVAAITVIVVLGSSLGLGMPHLLSYFARSIPIENRGKIGGLTFFIVTISAPFVIVTTSMMDLVSSAIFLSIWRSWSIPITFLFPKKDGLEFHYERRASFISVFRDKSFGLYFLAWLMFSMVDGLEEMLSTQIGKSDLVMNVVQLGIAGFSALIAGMFADWTGRKRVIISGFVSLGIAYAILGIAPQLLISRYFFIVVSGFAIGLLWTMFTIVMWGELSRHGAENYYAVGEAPYFLTQLVSLLFAPYVALIPGTSAFSLAAFFLFIAVIPLLYAPETLPEKKIQDRQLKIYTEEALKIRQKVEQKQK